MHPASHRQFELLFFQNCRDGHHMNFWKDVEQETFQMKNLSLRMVTPSTSAACSQGRGLKLSESGTCAVELY